LAAVNLSTAIPNDADECRTEVVAARKGRVYVEVGPGELKESRMTAW